MEVWVMQLAGWNSIITFDIVLKCVGLSDEDVFVDVIHEGRSGLLDSTLLVMIWVF